MHHARTKYPGQSWHMSSAMTHQYESDPLIEWFELGSVDIWVDNVPPTRCSGWRRDAKAASR
jgi:hypothetical protein